MAHDGPPYGDALAGTLDALDDFVPGPALPLPEAALSVASLQERSVGIGGLRGLDFRGRFSVGELKAIRLEALVRYDVWGDTPTPRRRPQPASTRASSARAEHSAPRACSS